MKRRLCWLTMLAVCLMAGGDTAPAQTVFPVRLAVDPPILRAEGTGALKIHTTTHYKNRVALVVTPDTLLDTLRVVYSEDDTTVTGHYIATAFRTGLSGISVCERVFSFHRYGNAVSTRSRDVELSPDFYIFQHHGDDWTLRIETPAGPSPGDPGYDRVTLWIEMFTDKPVTFVELF